MPAVSVVSWIHSAHRTIGRITRRVMGATARRSPRGPAPRIHPASTVTSDPPSASRTDTAMRRVLARGSSG